MQIYIRHPFALSFCLLLAIFFDAAGVIRASVLSIFLHECGHTLLFVLLLHQKPVFHVDFGGISLQWNTAGAGFAQQAAILFAGPFVNGIAAAICCIICFYKMRLSLYLFGGVNLLLGLFNLLPLGFLDGGRLLELVLLRFFPYEKAWKGSRLMQILTLLFLGASLLLFSADLTTRIALLLFLSYYCCKSFSVKN